jgi:hypothetical protein
VHVVRAIVVDAGGKIGQVTADEVQLKVVASAGAACRTKLDRPPLALVHDLSRPLDRRQMWAMAARSGTARPGGSSPGATSASSADRAAVGVGRGSGISGNPM